MEVYVNGKRIKLNPSRSIGKGGEAEVFAIGGDKALKVFKQPDCMDYQGLPAEQQAARDRLATHQIKLRSFPSHLPERAIAPEQLATDKQGKHVLGYTMPLLKGANPLLQYSNRNFRTSSGIANETIASIFEDLHDTVSKLHAVNVAIGDFNDLNVMVLKNKAYLIDVDSFQYDRFLCRMFTARFVDPLLCDPAESRPVLQQAYHPDSDWYAFTVMLMQCLLFVDPYGGVYKPKDDRYKISHETRPLQRITIFHPDVKYPKPAIPYKVLSDDLLHHFHLCFERDRRGTFPMALLADLHWTKCPSYGVESTRDRCPICHRSQFVTQNYKELQVQIVRDAVTAVRVFQTTGVILEAALHGDVLKWLYYDRGSFKREDGSAILAGDLDAQTRFWLQGKSTLVGKNSQVISLGSRAKPVKLGVESDRGLPACACNEMNCYWLYNGQLLREGSMGAEYIGDVLANRTWFWVGSRFGFGFYQAMDLHVAFIFDARGFGINDSVKLPTWQGQLVDADCVFSNDDYCWLFLAIQAQGRIYHRAHVMRANGEAIATAEVDGSKFSWLANIRGKFAAGNFLLAATDEGIVRLEPQGGKIVKVKEFPSAESFVDAGCCLYGPAQGLYVVNRSDIHLLKIA
jgi:H/ACA ribonucleoprotein complex subunit 3